MKVKELIDRLKEFSTDMKVTTFADYDESGTIYKVIAGACDNPNE